MTSSGPEISRCSSSAIWLHSDRSRGAEFLIQDRKADGPDDRRGRQALDARGDAQRAGAYRFQSCGAAALLVTVSRGAALTGHLVIKDRQGRKLALQCSGFGVDKDFVEFLRAAQAILANIGEVRPDLRVAPEPTGFHRTLMAGIIAATIVVVGAATIAFDAERDLATRAGGVAIGVLIAAGVVLFRYGPLRKKPQPLAPAELARQIAMQVMEPSAT
jgi:hypothetical protein